MLSQLNECYLFHEQIESFRKTSKNQEINKIIQSFGKKLAKLNDISMNMFDSKKVLYKCLIELLMRFEQVLKICKYEIAKDLLDGKRLKNNSVSMIFKCWRLFIDSIYKVRSFKQLLKILSMFTYLNRYTSKIISN